MWAAQISMYKIRKKERKKDNNFHALMHLNEFINTNLNYERNDDYVSATTAQQLSSEEPKWKRLCKKRSLKE